MYCGFWTESNPEEVHECTLVRSSDAKEFRAYRQQELIKAPLKCYSVVPNGEGLEDFLLLYVAWQNNCLAVKSDGQNSIEFKFSIWKSLLAALERYDYTRASTLCELLVGDSTPPRLNFKQLATQIERYIAVCTAPLGSGCLYRTAAPAAEWWDVTIDALQPLKQYAENHDYMAFGKHAQAIHKRLSSMLGKPLAEKFFDLSAFCIGLAERSLGAHHLQVALLYGFRAMDLYFQSLGLANGLLINTSDGVRYKHSATERVYLMGIEWQLKQTQIIAPSNTRASFLKFLNALRNQLLPTHGGHFVKDQEVRDAIADCLATAQLIEGNSRWEKTSHSFFPVLADAEAMFFNVLPDLATYIQIEPAPNLG